MKHVAADSQKPPDDFGQFGRGSVFVTTSAEDAQTIGPHLFDFGTCMTPNSLANPKSAVTFRSRRPRCYKDLSAVQNASSAYIAGLADIRSSKAGAKTPVSVAIAGHRCAAPPQAGSSRNRTDTVIERHTARTSLPAARIVPANRIVRPELASIDRIGGGAGGIRTHDTLLTYTHFPGERLRPLGHRSALLWKRVC